MSQHRVCGEALGVDEVLPPRLGARSSLRVVETVRILHVLPSLGLGGAERLVLNLIMNTAPSRFRHAVVQLNDPSDFAEAVRPRVDFVRKLDWSKRSDWPRASFEIARAARSFRPHIIQSAMFEASIAARGAAALGVRAAFVTNVVSLEYEPQAVRAAGWDSRRVAARRFIDQLSARLSSSWFVACAECVLQSTVHDLGIPRERVVRIYNGVDEKTLLTTPEAGIQLRRERGIAPDAFVFLIVSRLVPGKGQEIAIRAFARFAEHHPNAILAVAGTGPLEHELRTLAHSLGVEARVRFLGRVPETGPCFAMSDAFVFPSRLEGLPLSVIEAMMCGLPCIVSDIPANRELVEHESSGLHFAVDDARSLEAALTRLHADSALRTRISQAARTRALRDFSRDVIVSQWERFYERVAR